MLKQETRAHSPLPTLTCHVSFLKKFTKENQLPTLTLKDLEPQIPSQERGQIPNTELGARDRGQSGKHLRTQQCYPLQFQLPRGRHQVSRVTESIFCFENCFNKKVNSYHLPYSAPQVSLCVQADNWHGKGLFPLL